MTFITRSAEACGRNLDLNMLWVFVTVAECGCVTSAASRLHLTQPAVSSALRRLNESLGEAVFSRSGPGITLTARGDRLLLALHERLAGIVDAVFEPLVFEPLTNDRSIRMTLADSAEAGRRNSPSPSEVRRRSSCGGSCTTTSRPRGSSRDRFDAFVANTGSKDSPLKRGLLNRRAASRARVRLQARESEGRNDLGIERGFPRQRIPTDEDRARRLLAAGTHGAGVRRRRKLKSARATRTGRCHSRRHW